MSAPSSSEELQRWTAEAGEAVYRARRGPLTSDLWGSGSCGTLFFLISSGLLLNASGVVDVGQSSPSAYALFGGFFMVVAVACWVCTLSYWRERRALSVESPSITVESMITDDDRLVRTFTIGRVSGPCSRSWTEAVRLPPGEEATAFVARHAVEDARWEETIRGGTLLKSTSDDEDETRRSELRALLLEGRRLARCSELEPGREVTA